jgi:hypothetical protein
LSVAVASLRADNETGVESNSIASVGADKTADLDVNVAVLGFSSSEEAPFTGSATEGTVGSDLTAPLQVNVAVLGLSSSEEAPFTGSATEGTVGSDLTAGLQVSIDTPSSTLETINVESDSQASLAADLTASLEVLVQSLTSVTETTNVESDSQASVGADKTVSLEVNVAVLGFTSSEEAPFTGSATEETVGADLTASLEVSVQSLTSVTETTNVESDSQASIAADLTASLEVFLDSLQSKSETVNVESNSQASIAADLTASLDVLVNSLTSVSETTNVESNSQASVGADKTADLDINVAVLGFAGSELSSFTGDTTEATVPTELAATTDGEVTGSGDLRKSQLVDCDLDAAVAATYLRTADTSVTIQGTETRSASLEMLIAETASVTADTSVTIKGTELRTGDLDALVQGTTELTADLNQAIATTDSVSALLDQLVKAIQFRYAALDVNPSPERRFLLPLDALVQGVFEKTADLSLIVQATEELAAALDLIIEVRRPYSLLKLWGDTSTRFFGGTASDTNFFEHFEPHPAAVTTQTFGSITPGDREVTFQVPNTIPTAASYDKYSLPFAATHSVATVGYRVLVCFELRSFGPNNTLLLGAFTGTNSPVTDIWNGDFVGMALEAEKGHVEFRAWAGGNESSRAYGTGLPVDRFVNVPLLLEIETVSATAGLTDMQFRLFDRAFNLDRPLALIDLQTSVPPATTHFAITSLGRRTVELPTAQADMHVDLTYVDIEPGTGTRYEPTYIDFADAKLRGFQDRPPLTLSNQGVNDIYVLLADSASPSSFTDTKSDSITVDSSDPVITVVTFTTDSPVLVPFSTNPPIVKGSLNSGFSGVAMSWYATHAGTWTLRVNSTGVADGIELRSGSYPTAFETVSTGWDFSELPQVDDVYDVTLYLIAESGKPTAKRLGEYLLP